MSHLNLKNKTVAVAMSGGVDSTSTAIMLMEAGANVFGLTMDIAPTFLPEPPTIREAAQMAKRLGIAHHSIYLKPDFDQHVLSPFCKSYISGRTPNPCVVCNREMKFGILLDKAKQLGADYLATGHYVRRIWDAEAQVFRLLRGVDKYKEQSYFLFTLTQNRLRHILFPLGAYRKAQTREFARSHGFEFESKPESQEICFLQDKRYTEFLELRVPELMKSGLIKNLGGETFGEHRGIAYYTIGQRRGLGVALGKPAYVVKLDAETNTVYLGSNDDLLQKELVATEVNWIAGPPTDLRVTAKIRYKNIDKPAIIKQIEQNTWHIHFDEAQRAITPGQAVVFYDGEEMLGGGWIRLADNAT